MGKISPKELERILFTHTQHSPTRGQTGQPLPSHLFRLLPQTHLRLCWATARKQMMLLLTCRQKVSVSLMLSQDACALPFFQISSHRHFAISRQHRWGESRQLRYFERAGQTTFT